MTHDEVKNLVREQIDGQWDATNAHGVDLRRCLIPPVRVSMKATRPVPNGVAVEEVITVWIVLEECPDTRAGYKIVLEEDAGEFGLAMTCDDGQFFYLGRYGDFMTTLDAM